MEEFKKIVALSFIKVHNKYPFVNTKTALAKKLSKEIADDKLIEPYRHYKTLLIYYDYFFRNGKKQDPTDTVIYKLLRFLNYDSFEQFVRNQPQDLNYLETVPFIDHSSISSKDKKRDKEVIKKQAMEVQIENGSSLLSSKKKIVITIDISFA